MSTQDNYFDRIPAKYQIFNKEVRDHKSEEEERKAKAEGNKEGDDEEILHNLDKDEAKALVGKEKKQNKNEEGN